MPYERIVLNLDGVSIQLEITNSCLIEFYKDNPERVKNYFLAHISEAVSDIESGEGLDDLVKKINLGAIKEKISLLDNVQRDRQNISN